MAVKFFLVFVTVLAFVEFIAASPTRRQYAPITEASPSDSPVTNEENAWDDNDEFDLDGEGWFSQAPPLPSSTPEQAKSFSDYDDDYSNGNVMVEFGDNDDDDDQDDEDDEIQEQEAEEDDGSKNDSEFLFVPPKDTRLVLEDDDDQSGPIKVRHTGRSSYPRVSEPVDNSLDSSDEGDKAVRKHPYEFTIDENDKDDDDNDDDEDPHKKDDDSSVETRQDERDDENDDDNDDEDELVSEGDDSSEMFDDPEGEAAQVIYGDHVFLY